MQAKIFDLWYESEKDEFDSREAFLSFVEGLKEVNPDEYRELYGSHRKKLKDT